MLLRTRTFIHRYLSLAESVYRDGDPSVVKINNLPRMGDSSRFKKIRYDGRTKKRQWEDRRSDKGEGIREPTDESKKTKTDENTTDIIVEKDKIKRRKYCLLLGYSGTNYFGMQRNPNTKTIEEDLINALYKVKLIDESGYNQVQNMQFQRAARTDKGVSAARQIVSLKLRETIDLAEINAELPEVIRVFAYKRVTKGFNSKSQCDSRTYIYLLPTVAFSPHNAEVSQKEYRVDDATFEKVNRMLQHYVGTKNFHNFTSKKKHSDPSAKRYMKSFVMEKPFIKDDVEFAILKVQGQSFMLHQIRKMVGCLLAVLRGLATEDIMENAFKIEKVTIPRAPGLGLVLEFVHYERYNNRYGGDGVHEKLTWEECDAQIEEFKDKYIFPTIIDQEIKEENMLGWIHNKLSRHSYDLEEEENESDDEFAGDDDKDDDKVEIVQNSTDTNCTDKGENVQDSGDTNCNIKENTEQNVST